jgi:hypothetical protein
LLSTVTGEPLTDARSFGNELLKNLLTFVMEAVPGCVGTGLSVADDMTAPGDGAGSCTIGAEVPGAPRSVAAVGVAAVADIAQWQHARGPIWEAFRSGRLVVRPPLPIGDGEEPDGAGHALAFLGDVEGMPSPVLGAVFSAGEWGGELPVVLSVYLDRPADDRALREIDRYEPMVTQALAVVEYCAGEAEVARQMLQMTQYRRVIEQAKGLVMGAAGGDAGSAFATLARASQHFNVRLRTLAVALVEHVGGGDVEHPDDPDLVVRPSSSEREVAARVWAALTTAVILPT